VKTYRKVERHKIIDVRLNGLQLRSICNSLRDCCNRRLKVGLSFVSIELKPQWHSFLPSHTTHTHNTTHINTQHTHSNTHTTHKYCVNSTSSDLRHDQVHKLAVSQVDLHVSGCWQLQIVQIFQIHGSTVVSRLEDVYFSPEL
jgi:hypothetical protein